MSQTIELNDAKLPIGMLLGRYGRNKVLGVRVRISRENKELNQSQLARTLDVNRSFICRVEKGTERPTIETLCKLADVLNVSTDWLLGRE